jgi:hypothetical protein
MGLLARASSRIRRKFIALVALPGYVPQRLNFRRRCGVGDCPVAPAFERTNMIRLLSRVAAAIVGVIAVVASSADAQAERRVALVVGNSNYKTANISLSNPRNDAQDIAAVLGNLGFEVITTIDAGKREMDLALQRFARLATDADSALFFYAGHALQFQGRNYLMPTDAELEDEIRRCAARSIAPTASRS